MLFIPLALGLGYKATKFLAVWGPRVYMAGSLYFTLSGTKKELSKYFELRVGSASYDLEALIGRGDKGPDNLPFKNIANQGPCALNANGQLIAKDNVIIQVNQTQYFFDGKNIFLAFKKDKAKAAKFIEMSVPKDNLEYIQLLPNSEPLNDEAQGYIDNLFMETEEKERQNELEQVIAAYPEQWKRVIKQLQIAMDRIYEGKDYTLWEDLENKLGNVRNEDTSEYMHCLGYMIKMHHIGEQYTLIENTVSPHSAFVAGGTIAKGSNELQDYEQTKWYHTGDRGKMVQHRDSLNDNLQKLKAIEQEYNKRKAITLNSKNENEKININPKDTKDNIERKIKLRMEKDFPKPSFWEAVRGLFSFILGPTPYMQVHKLLFKGLVEENLGKIVTTEFELEGKIQAEKAQIEKEIALTDKKIALVAEVQEKITAEKDAIQNKAVELKKNIEELKKLERELNDKKTEVQGQADKQKTRIELVDKHIKEASALQIDNGGPVVTPENISTPKETIGAINQLNEDIKQLMEAVSIGGLEKEIEAVYKNAALIIPLEGAQMLSSAAEVVADLIPDFSAEVLDTLTASVTALHLEITEEDGNKGSIRLAKLRDGKECLGKKELEIGLIRNNLNAFEMDLGLYQDKLGNAEDGIAAYETKSLKIVEATIPVLMHSILKKIETSKSTFTEAKKEAEENPFFDKEKLQQAFANRNSFLEKLREDPGFDANNAVSQSFLKFEPEFSAENKDWSLQLEDKIQELTTKKVKAAVHELQNKISEGLNAIQDLQAVMAGENHSYQYKVQAVWEAIEKLEDVLKELDGLMAEVEKATKEARENKAQTEKLRNVVGKWVAEAEENKKRAREQHQQEATNRVELSLMRAEKAKDSIEENIVFLQDKTTGNDALKEANDAIRNIKQGTNNITLPVEDSIILQAEKEAEKAEAAAKRVITAAAVKQVEEAKQATSEIKQIFDNVQAAQRFVQETFSALTDSSASAEFVYANQISGQAVAAVINTCAEEVKSAEANCISAEDSFIKFAESTMQESYAHMGSIKQSVQVVNACLKEAKEQEKQAERAKEQSQKQRAEFLGEAGYRGKNTGEMLRRHLGGFRANDLKSVKESMREKIEESREMVGRGRDLSEQFAQEAIEGTKRAVDLSRALLQEIEASSDTLTHLHQDIQEAVDAGNFPQVKRIHENAVDSKKCNEQQYNVMLAAILMEKAHSMLHAKAKIARIVRTYQEGAQNEEKRKGALAAIAAQEAKIKNMGYIATELQKLNDEAINVTLSQLMKNDVPALLVENDDGQRLYGKEFDLLLVNLQELALDIEILKLGLNSDKERMETLSEKKNMRKKREYDLEKEEALANNLRIATLLTSIMAFNTNKLDDAGILSTVSSLFGEILGTSEKSAAALELFSGVKNFINGSDPAPVLEFMIVLLNKIHTFQKHYPANEAALKWREEVSKILYALLGIHILAKKLARINIEIYKAHFEEINKLFKELCQPQPGDRADKLKVLQNKISTFDAPLAAIEPVAMVEAFYSANGLQWSFASKAPTAAEVMQDIIEQAKQNYPLDPDASYRLCSSLRLEMRVYIQQPIIQRKDNFKEWLFESWQALVQARDESVGKTVDEDFTQREVNTKINKAIQDFYEKNSLALSFPESNLTPAVIMKCFMGQGQLQDKKPHEVHKQYKELRKVVKKVRDEDPDNKMYYEKWLRASRLVELGECRDKGLGMFVRPASILSSPGSVLPIGTPSGEVIKRKLGTQS